jgi:methanol:N,N-dimethyl-4-nitrosoaniline oxidoreductase
MTKHLLGDGSTPGNAREVTYEAVSPMVRHALTGSYY